MAEADTLINPRAVKGDNAPPALDLHKLHIEELLAEAQGFLDGEPIADQAQADAIGTLLGMLREAKKGADAARADEKRVHDEAGKAVQAAWLPIINRADLALDTAKKALAPWLEAQEAEKRAVAEAARLEAETKAAAARAAMQAADPTNLADRERVEALLKDASKADKAANRAAKDKPMAAGHGRAVSLRSRFTAVLTDSAVALKHFKETQPAALRQFLTDQAQADVNAGARAVPGFRVDEERVAQ
jgi:hypothetical protein